MTYAPAPCKKRKERGTQILIPICQGPGHPPSYFQNYFINNPGQAPNGPDADEDDD